MGVALLRAGGGEERREDDRLLPLVHGAGHDPLRRRQRGPTGFDPVSTIVDWVEKGKAPAAIRASHVVNNQVVRTRPLCPYPQVAKYSGKGSVDEAASFSCANP